MMKKIFVRGSQKKKVAPVPQAQVLATTDAIALRALGGVGTERGQNSPTRDEEFMQSAQSYKPALLFPDETTRNSDNVQSIWEQQLRSSAGFDMDVNQVYSSMDYVVPTM